jgi:hypothetical protein
VKLLGKYKAVAGKTEYTNEQILTQVKLVTLWDNIPEESLPWAEYQMPIGAVFVPAKVGDLVWVEFPQEGDSRYPDYRRLHGIAKRDAKHPGRGLR